MCPRVNVGMVTVGSIERKKMVEKPYGGEVLLYKTDDGETRIEVRLVTNPERDDWMPSLCWSAFNKSRQANWLGKKMIMRSVEIAMRDEKLL